LESPAPATEALPVTAEAAPKPKAGGRSPVPLPTGPELLQKIRPHMRRNRRGPGGSGSTSFLARALRTSEAELMTAFTAIGLNLPEKPGDQPVFAEFGQELWWLNRDNRGGVWINGREKKTGETAASATAAEPVAPGSESTPVAEAAPAVETPAVKTDHVFTAVRLLLKATKTGAVAGEIGRLAGELGKSEADCITALTGAGLKVPEKAREKPVFVEHAGEIFWFNRNAKGQLWLNAKASKFADKDGEAEGATGDKPKRSRSKKKE
jgi:hypothetical protein